MAKKLRVAVLMGGASGEREVSLASGRGVVKALEASGKFEALPVKVTKQGKLPPMSNIDVAFIAMHGKGGEDGTIQAVLELLKIPYTGSGVLASALGMDKVRSLALFRDAGLTVPDYFVVREFKGAGLKFKYPVVTKPNYHGSSLGVSICRSAKELNKGIALAKKYNKDVIVQQFVDGIELTCAVLGNEKPKALPVVEIIANKGDFYDYASKYDEDGSDHIIPARIPAALAKKVRQQAIKAHQIIGCRGFSRTDFIWDKKSNQLYVLEINTIPGLTPTSLFPDAARAAGHEFSELIEKLIHLALENR
ncbi:D-alanine--D-alanine ligase [Candidatus Berkelbacteria bacterium]|nr:D-alanine--D-alanine ligase [Candidatus Berkelbacteria bacterium]